VIDGENGGDDSVDPTCVGWWESERPRYGWGSQKEWGSLFQMWCAAYWIKRFVVLRDKEVGGLDMVTTDEDWVLRGDWTVISLERYIGSEVERIHVPWPTASAETWEQEWCVRPWEIWQQYERELFWICWSRFIWEFGSLKYSELQ